VSWILVTPARNERDRLPRLAESLRAQAIGTVGLWVVVDDGSTDGTADCLDPTSMPFPTLVTRRANAGGLVRASEFGAFLEGAAMGIDAVPDADRVMKVDADMSLADDYVLTLQALPGSAGVVSGVIAGEAEQRSYSPGALKAYSRPAFEVVRRLPVALGWDVVDNVAVQLAGMTVEVCPKARAFSQRRTGFSEGSIGGRRRGGIVSRWTGYHPLYFGARIVRYTFRRPYGVGAIAMVYGYATAGRGPFSEELRTAMREQQATKLRDLARRPVRSLRELYGRSR
jgi:hypothetical protein